MVELAAMRIKKRRILAIVCSSRRESVCIVEEDDASDDGVWLVLVMVYAMICESKW